MKWYHGGKELTRWVVDCWLVGVWSVYIHIFFLSMLKHCLVNSVNIVWDPLLWIICSKYVVNIAILTAIKILIHNQYYYKKTDICRMKGDLKGAARIYIILFKLTRVARQTPTREDRFGQCRGTCSFKSSFFVYVMWL